MTVSVEIPAKLYELIREDLGLKVDPTNGRLELTRPAGLAYFYYEM